MNNQDLAYAVISEHSTGLGYVGVGLFILALILVLKLDMRMLSGLRKPKGEESPDKEEG